MDNNTTQEIKKRGRKRIYNNIKEDRKQIHRLENKLWYENNREEKINKRLIEYYNKKINKILEINDYKKIRRYEMRLDNPFCIFPILS